MIRLAIGIPTRNRADLAMGAVESVLRSALPNVTVVVSDNSTDEEERERLERFCAQRTDEVVQYVRPPKPLEMAAHWEWLRLTIRRQDRHTHMAYLTDRMVFTEGALNELMSVVEREPERVISYHFDRVEDAEPPAALVQTQWTGQVLELDAGRLIELSRRGEWGDYLPRMLNCIAPLSCAAAIEDRYGSVFALVSPDYSFAYRCLATRDTILYLDRACLIEYGMSRSAGISYMRGRFNRDAANFQRELSVHRFGATPEPAFETAANALYQEYCSVRRETGGDRFPPLDRRSYLTANALSIARIEDPEWRTRMEELLERCGWKRRYGVRHTLNVTLMMAGYFISHPGALARSVKRQLWDRPPGTPFAYLLPRIGLSPRIRDELQFDSSADAIAYAAAHPRRRMPYAWHVHRLRHAGAVVRASAPPTPR
jgi:hypothetical protein